MEKISANIGTRLFYPKNIWDSMNKELLITKNVTNFGLVSVNGGLIFFMTKYYEFFNISRTLEGST